MNSKQFLQIGGVVLVLVGLLGFFGLLGPTAEDSLFGEAWWFDNAENWAHLVIGVVAMVAAYMFSEANQKMLTMAVGVIALFAGLYSLFGYSYLFGANLENPLDTLLHLAVGGWALWAGMRKG